MSLFKLKSQYRPTGDQPEAIAGLVANVEAGRKFQTLLGVTGSGKTFTIANAIARLGMPTLVISHNKTLAAQLYGEMKSLFPENAVEYFISYYDYYQPEAFIPSTDTYIEKDASINEDIDRLRLHATGSLLTRRDVIVVASVSCIYGLGSPEEFGKLSFTVSRGERAGRDEILRRLVTDPVFAQRRRFRARHLQGARRHDRALAGVSRGGRSHRASRRRRRPDLRHPSADRRDDSPDRSGGDIPLVPFRHFGRESRRRDRIDREGARSQARRAPRPGEGIRGETSRDENALRYRDAPRDGLLPRNRELLEAFFGAASRRSSGDAHRLFSGRFSRRRRRIARDDSADPRHVRGGPEQEEDARRARLQASLGARQPAAHVRRIRGPRPPR